MKRFIHNWLCLLLIIAGSHTLQAQDLQPGFDAEEFADMLHLNFYEIGDSNAIGKTYPMRKGNYEKILHSPEVGMYNRCQVLLRNKHTAVLSIRGTIGKTESWLENFYAAMVKANGSIQLNDNTNFTYQLAANDGAFVHVGWLLGLAHMAPYFTQSLDSLLSKGINDIIVTGHSQGGALAFLTTSYIWYKYHDKYPGLRLKTYAGAAPKPGNLQYAYDFDFITRNGYGYRVVNSADWVPETPLTVQTTTDFNELNPFTDAKKILKKQKFFVRLVLTHIYNRMDKASYKTMCRYKKYLGKKLYKQVKKTLQQYPEPDYANSSNYMTAGSPIILLTDSAYHSRYTFDGKNIFVHHAYQPYQELLEQYYLQKK